MKQYSRVCARIDLSAVEYNFEQMHQNIKPETKILAVIKADGYGHGALPIAKMMEPKEYLWGFATATVEEAVALRKKGIKKPILLLGYAFYEHFEDIVRNDLRPCVFTMDTAKKLSEISVRLKKTLRIHFALDTGMTRIGFAPNEESITTMVNISKLPNLEVEGLFTHFARADETDVEPAYQQLYTYMRFVVNLEQAGLEIPLCHCSNSAGIIRLPDANMDLVRAGISIYGLYPSEEVEKDMVDLKPAMSLISHISYIKEVEEGVQVSYGGTFTTTRKTKVATIPVGYADGYPRQLSNKGYVLVHGKKAPILGRVCMDQFMVDVTDIPSARALDEAVLLGESEGKVISAMELGELSGRFHYELVCDISKRVPRVYYYEGTPVASKDYFDC